MLTSPYLLEQARHDWIHATEAPSLENIPDEASLLRQLRRHKHYWQYRYVNDWLQKKISQEEFLLKISSLAERIIACALDWQFEALAQRYGRPEFTMSVLAMGKLGGGELNFSSDVDLILTYRHGGEALRGAKSTDYAVFFQKLTQKLVFTLEHFTADGQVYRVDLRLRPFGQSGALALTHEAMEQYYTIHGRDWERYALMKARPIAGDIEGGKRLLQALRPFIYRRYWDYRALQAIAEMKQSINQNIREAGMERHLKLGWGGIREAEFAVQAMQMVYGGQYPPLQSASYLQALEQLHLLHLWPRAECEALREAYLWLRTVENALQFKDEAQTHSLPEREEDWPWLAAVCHTDSVRDLQQRLSAAQQLIHHQFNMLFVQTEQGSASTAGIDWRNPAQDLGQRCSPSRSALFQQFAQRLPWTRLPQDSIKHLDKILPQLLDAEEDSSVEALLHLLEQIARRVSYTYLLAEHPPLIQHLLHIAARSRWLMEFISAHPLVLDDMLTARALPSLSSLEHDLAARVQHLDDEAFSHALRDFKNAHLFKTAWRDVNGQLPLMQVSDRLTHIAELIVRQIVTHARQHLTAKHGIPRHSDGSEALFAMVAYGKLGGLELGYGSDLDLIFLYDDGAGGCSDGEKPFDNQIFFTRLAQRIIHLLSFTSINGVLYHCDTRLRPHGQSGLLLSHIQRFERYQHEEAQTWEHQALTRARCINGDEALQQQFQKIRAEILQKPRQEALLRQEVLAMRQKMREAAGNVNDVKHGLGGLIDIEFMVQYLLLLHAQHEPTLTRMSDNIRQLAALEALGILNSSDAMTLRDAYRQLRAAQHHHYLNQEKALLDDKISAKVQSIMQQIFASEDE